MVVDLPRRWRWAIGGSCGAVLLLGLGFIGSARVAGDATSASPMPAAPPALAELPFAEAPVDPAVPEEPAPGPARGADEVQVCGGAWVRTGPDGSVDPAALDRAAQLPQWRARILDALRADPGDLPQAVALLLAAPGVPSPAAADALARRAVGTTDPRVYALAFKACGGGERGEGACRMLRAEQWARLDPDNAAPWHFVATAAAARGDRAALDEAMFRLASAKRSTSGAFDVVGAVLAALPDDEASALAAQALVVQAAAVEGLSVLPGYSVLLQSCRGAALRDANRAQTCTALAEGMAERSDTLIERMMGAALGRQTGWPSERVDRLRGEYLAYMAELNEPLFPDDAEALTCDGIRRTLDGARRRAALGEVGALREWVDASGRGADHFIARARADHQRAAAAAAAASAPASGPGS